MENIFLIGFMGTGKSTIANGLGKMYSMNVLEMDEEIVRREGVTIPEIFASKGESYFRELETKLLMEVPNHGSMIVSCGGGVVLKEENVAQMRKLGTVVLLTATPETILERVKDDENRPLLQGNKNVTHIKSLIDQRRDKYEAAADIVIAVDHKNVQEICEELIQALQH